MARQSQGPLPPERDALVRSEEKNLAIRALRARYFDGRAKLGFLMTFPKLAEEVGISEDSVQRLVRGYCAELDAPKEERLLAWYRARKVKMKRASRKAPVNP